MSIVTVEKPLSRRLTITISTSIISLRCPHSGPAYGFHIVCIIFQVVYCSPISHNFLTLISCIRKYTLTLGVSRARARPMRDEEKKELNAQQQCNATEWNGRSGGDGCGISNRGAYTLVVSRENIFIAQVESNAHSEQTHFIMNERKKNQQRKRRTEKEKICFARGATIYCFAKCKRFYKRTNERTMSFLRIFALAVQVKKIKYTQHDNTTLLPTTTNAAKSQSASPFTLGNTATITSVIHTEILGLERSG